MSTLHRLKSKQLIDSSADPVSVPFAIYPMDRIKNLNFLLSQSNDRISIFLIVLLFLLSSSSPSISQVQNAIYCYSLLLEKGHSNSFRRRRRRGWSWGSCSNYWLISRCPCCYIRAQCLRLLRLIKSGSVFTERKAHCQQISSNRTSTFSRVLALERIDNGNSRTRNKK